MAARPGAAQTGAAQTGAARTQEQLAGSQFGAQAGEYLASAVHAVGDDLVALAALADGFAGAAALDLGCGGGHVSFTLAPRVGSVVACDLSAAMLGVVAAEAARRGLANLATRQASADRLPFADAGFDLVCSRYSAHHWRDLPAGLREAARVLRPGGTAVFIDTVSPGTPVLDTFLQAIELLRDPSHVRNHTRAEWEAMLAAAGLAVGLTRAFPLRLDFASWVARMRTPSAQVAAIRALQAAVAEDVRRHFAVAADGSFSLAVAMLVATRPA
ncbi:MAG TPA: methyltransferase domain-containing protein [Acetobacteraceae bacterium]|nr:methyltransferase domain-containing protein [Acetobacteraceae bacterium]